METKEVEVENNKDDVVVNEASASEQILMGGFLKYVYLFVNKPFFI